MMKPFHTTTLFNRADIDWESIPCITITSIAQLANVLTGFLQQQPRIIELVSSTGNRLQLGVGGMFACAQFFNADNMPPYLCAKAKNICAKEDVKFLLGGTPTPVAPEQCMSFSDAQIIAEYFYEKGEYNPTFEWIEV